MTKNERRLAGILALTLCLAAFALLAFSSLLRIRDAEAAEVSLGAAIAKMGRETEPAVLQGRIDELKRRLAVTAAAGEAPALADFGTSMKALLTKRGLAPGRYQISGSEGGEYIEFAVSGSMLAFLTFLREAETRGASLASLAFRTVPVGVRADFVFRIRHGE